MVGTRDWKDAPDEAQEGIFPRLNFNAVAAPHFDAGKDKDGSEAINDPMKAAQQRDTCEDHQCAHYQRAENSPKQDPMPVGRLHMKVAEEQGEDENVVHA